MKSNYLEKKKSNEILKGVLKLNQNNIKFQLGKGINKNHKKLSNNLENEISPWTGKHLKRNILLDRPKTGLMSYENGYPYHKKKVISHNYSYSSQSNSP